MRAVLDASAAVDALLPSARRAAVLHHIREAELWAPGLVDSELLSAFARLERTGAISAREGTDALGEWSLLRCQRVPSELLLQDAWSRRAALRVSDAQYVALADRLGAPLLTSDARLARAPVGQVKIQLIQ